LGEKKERKREIMVLSIFFYLSLLNKKIITKISFLLCHTFSEERRIYEYDLGGIEWNEIDLLGFEFFIKQKRIIK